jgi:hypothetical protein
MTVSPSQWSHLLARLIVRGVLANLAPIGDLSAPIMPRQARPAFDFAADRAAAPAQDLGNLCERLIRFHEAVDLLSFFSAEVLVHWATSTW